MMALADVDALVEAARIEERKWCFAAMREELEQVALDGSVAPALVKIAVEEERKRCADILCESQERRAEIVRAAVDAERERLVDTMERFSASCWLVVNDDLDGAASPVDCVWSAHTTPHEAVAKAEENLLDPDAHLMAVLEIQPGETPKQVWTGGNGGRNGKRWGRYHD